MNKNDKKDLQINDGPSIDEHEHVANNRRKLMTKLAAGAFAVPTVLASISANAAPASGPLP